ncbi:pilus assembly protein [Phenylobacterium sp. LjRoot219]|uniref:TadE/TadG family type IV pilus assembly protein n=1 Tax=Phenylobacterium sp. LjRoot219 TaxID=3342283 RepID=UPI003ECF706B
MIRRLQSFGRCERGAAALEFGLIAPILILFHFGSVEFVQAWEAHRRVTHVAAALADLTAQKRAVTQAEVDDILKAGGLMIAPFPADRLSVRISSFSTDSSGKVTQDWTRSRNWTAAGQATVPKGYLAASESVIVANVAYEHKAMFGLAMSPSVKMGKDAYLRPRLSNQVLGP